MGVTDFALTAGESLNFDLDVTPIGPHHVNPATFGWEFLGHGAVPGLDIGGGSFAFADDDDPFTSADILNPVGPSDISGLTGDPLPGQQTLTVGIVGGALLSGVSSLSFEITAAPEPTSAALCGLFLVGACVRRRRRES